jgi:hypothetical protein
MRRRATFSRRSRSALAWAAGLFVAGQLVAGLVLDYAFPLTRFPSAGQVLDYAASEPSPPAVIFLGSSRTGTGIDVAEANRVLAATGRQPPPRVINAAVPAGDALSAEFVFTHLLEKGAKPAWAVVEVSPEALNVRSPFMKEHAVRQLNWEDVPARLGDVLRSQSGWLYLESRMLPVYTHRRQLVREAKDRLRRWLPDRAAAKPAPATKAPADPVADKKAAGALDWDAIIRARANPTPDERLEMSRIGAQMVVRRWLRDYRPAGPAAVSLDRLLARCRDEGIGVILLAVPACSAHRAEYTPEVEAAFRGYLDRLVAEYGCRFVDARDWVPDEMYVDALHILPENGKAFTERLVREVLVPLMR